MHFALCKEQQHSQKQEFFRLAFEGFDSIALFAVRARAKMNSKGSGVLDEQIWSINTTGILSIQRGPEI
jgi:hypothetical protein